MNREGQLIRRDFRLVFDEIDNKVWPSDDLSDFLDKYGSWFSRLVIATIDHEGGHYPMSEEKIEQIRQASRIPFVTLEVLYLEPYIALLFEPHVRLVRLEQVIITESNVDVLRNHQWEKLTFFNCKFTGNSLQMLHQNAVPNICMHVSRAEDILHNLANLPLYPALKRLTLLMVDLNGCLDVLPCLTNLQELRLPHGTTEEDLERLSTLTNLVEIDISLCEVLTSKVATSLSRLPNLRVLDIGNCRVGPSPLEMTPFHCELIVKACPLLTHLYWSCDDMHDTPNTNLLTMIHTLAQLKHLESICLLKEPKILAGLDRPYLEEQLLTLTHPTLKSISVHWTVDLLQETQ